MKISTITCHDVYNSGASLQAYALQEYLKSLGHEVEIIDYKPDYLSNHYRFFKMSNPKWDKNLCLRAAYLFLKTPKFIASLKKKRKFDQFKKNYLQVTNTRYHSNADLCFSPPVADAFIAGSDQIWNTVFKNGADASFYLNFAPRESIRLSYAASFATSEIREHLQHFVQSQLHNFTAISTRESCALDMVQKMGFDNSTWVCDPVFLLERSIWEKLPSPPQHEKYILIYDFDNSTTIQTIAKELSAKHNLKIYTINSTNNYADKCIPYAGPLDFLSLVKNAHTVVANSFHALAFSLIFKKEFYIIPRNEGINTRMYSLLHYLNLKDRFITDVSKISASSIDYTAVDEKLSYHISNSKKFITTQLAPSNN